MKHGVSSYNFCLIKSVFPEDTIEQIKHFDAELATADEVEKLTILKDFNNELIDDNIGIQFRDAVSRVRAAPDIAQKEFEALSDEEKTSMIHRAQFFLAFFMRLFTTALPLWFMVRSLLRLCHLHCVAIKKLFVRPCK